MNDDPAKRIDTAATIARLHEALKRRDVSAFYIFHVAQGVERPMNVSSLMLEPAADYLLLTKSVDDSPAVSSFLVALEAAKPLPADRVADLRWGCVFCDKDGARVLSVYFDAKGERGVIDGACYVFQSAALSQWAESVYPTWMK